MKKQLFFFDMDGTLISRKGILPSTINAIASLQKMGHACFLCTGRSYQMAMEYSDVIHPDGVVFCNGAGIMIGDQLVHASPFSLEDVNKIRHLCMMHGGGLQLLNEEYSFQNFLNGLAIRMLFPKRARHLSEEMRKRRESMVWMNMYKGQPVYKADVFFFSKKQAERFYARLPHGLRVFKTRGRYLYQGEIISDSISKADGVLRVAQLLGVDLSDTWCFGDSINDVEMMHTCGHSIAMGNGSFEAKEAADYITDDNNHDGIVKALQYYGWRVV